MGLIVGAIWWVMVAGLRYVRVTNATIDVQRSCLTALARVTQELTEANQFGFETTGSEIIFVSPRDENGRLRYDIANRLLWQKLVVFYLDTVNGSQCLMRKEKLLDKPVSKAQTPPSVATLRNDPNLLPRLVASHISSFNVVRGNPDDPDVPPDSYVTITAISDVRTVESRIGKDFSIKITTSTVLKN